MISLAVPTVTSAQESVYRVAAGDQLTISVYGEPDLSLNKARVGSKGTITVPLLGDVAVAGLSTDELEEKLTGLFADGYLRKPVVSVDLLEYRPVYIHGEVATPGSYPYVESLTIEKAIALAGGFSRRASKRKIELVRDGGSDRGVQRAGLGDRVLPGDVITVGASIF